LTREEIRAGATELQEKLKRFDPLAVAYTGIGGYKWFRAISKVGWRVQEASAVPGVTGVGRDRGGSCRRPRASTGCASRGW